MENLEKIPLNPPFPKVDISGEPFSRGETKIKNQRLKIKMADKNLKIFELLRSRQVGRISIFDV